MKYQIDRQKDRQREKWKIIFYVKHLNLNESEIKLINY